MRTRLTQRLSTDISLGKVDADIVDLLEKLNKCRLYVTSSSCSGRIAVFAAPRPSDKKRGGIIRSWHRQVAANELLEAVNDALKQPYPYVWVSTQPPLLALHACSLQAANLAATIFAKHGFKYTGYRFNNSTRTYYLTVKGHDRIDVPLRVAGINMFEFKTIIQFIDKITFVLNDYLSRVKLALTRMYNAVDELNTRCESTRTHHSTVVWP